MKLTKQQQQERLDWALADLFVLECHDLAAEMGLTWPLSEADEALLNAEFDRRHGPRLAELMFGPQPKLKPELTHHMDWNGRENILVLDNGVHGQLEVSLDEFLEFVGELRDDLLLHGHPAFQPTILPGQDD